jgi:cardiolipin synthase
MPADCVSTANVPVRAAFVKHRGCPYVGGVETLVTVLADVGNWVAAVLTALLAVGTACHAILYKRDSRSATGWVGLIILVPVVGAVLYTLLGVNRIRRRASNIRRNAPPFTGQYAVLHGAERVLDSALDPPHRYLVSLGRYVDRVARRPLTTGNAVRPLCNGDAAYPEMLAAIEEARESIGLATYIFDSDETGRRFVDALARAVRRGVAVRVLVDGVGARYSRPSIVGVLAGQGVRVARFMPTLKPWSAPFWNLRNHRKLLLVDGAVGFTGGMNIRAGHVLSAHPRRPVQDLHFRFDGPVVQHLADAFADDWAFTTRETLDGPPWQHEVPVAGQVVARGIPDGPDADYDALHRVILGAIACARSSIRVVTPYFVPDAPLVTALAVAATRGVTVEIVLPAKSNLPYVHWATQALLWQILKRDVRVFVSPSPFDHSKLMTVDEAWALVGSANWDARSLRLNFEFNVECYDPALTAILNRTFEQKRDAARPVTAEEMDARSVPIRLRDGIARLASPYL